MKGPLFAPIDWVGVRTVLVDWVAEVTGCETIWADEGGPQPAYPYASINILPGTLEFGALDEQRPQDDGSLVIVGRRDFVLSTQIHVGGDQGSDAMANARIRADALVSSLQVPEFQDRLTTANLGLRERGQVQTLDLVVGADWIKRAQVDFRFATNSVVDVAGWPDLAKTGWFNKVRVTSEITPQQGGGNLDWNDELLDPNA